MHECARCGGRFPGPGVERERRLYCCDNCAAGPRAMIPRMASLALLMFTAGIIAGWFGRGARMAASSGTAFDAR